MTKHTQGMWRNQRGFTMLEMTIVMGVMAIIISGIWYGTATVTYKYKTSQTIKTVLEISKRVQVFYDSKDTTNGLTTDAAITARLIPNDVVAADGVSGINAFGGSLSIESIDTDRVLGGSTRNGFAIMLSKIPNDTCIDLLTKIGGTIQVAKENSVYNVTTIRPRPPRSGGLWPVLGIAPAFASSIGDGVPPFTPAMAATGPCDYDVNTGAISIGFYAN